MSKHRTSTASQRPSNPPEKTPPAIRLRSISLDRPHHHVRAQIAREFEEAFSEGFVCGFSAALERHDLTAHDAFSEGYTCGLSAELRRRGWKTDLNGRVHKCLHCRKPFEARRDAKYCSGRCRKNALMTRRRPAR